jgi:molecular chaperone IbpA
MRNNTHFTPFYRSSIGFDRIFNLLENASPPLTAGDWPSYDILKFGEDIYRIILAVAGFTVEELTITHERNLLVINGAKAKDEKQLAVVSPSFFNSTGGQRLRPFPVTSM